MRFQKPVVSRSLSVLAIYGALGSPLVRHSSATLQQTESSWLKESCLKLTREMSYGILQTYCVEVYAWNNKYGITFQKNKSPDVNLSSYL